METKIKNDLTHATKYDKVIQDYFALSHSEFVDQEDKGTQGRVWEKPYLDVTTIDKLHKVRVVFHIPAQIPFQTVYCRCRLERVPLFFAIDLQAAPKRSLLIK